MKKHLPESALQYSIFRQTLIVLILLVAFTQAKVYGQCPSVITPQPGPGVLISGNTVKFCAGDSVLLAAVPVGSTGFEWYLNNVLVPDSVRSIFTAKEAGTYKVKSPGCATNSNIITITVNPLPTASISSVPLPPICSGTTITFTLNTNASEFYWLPPIPPTAMYDNPVSLIMFGSTSIKAVALKNSTPQCSKVATYWVQVDFPIYGGLIADNQIICSGEIPAPLTHVADPSGGNGTYTYTWLKSTVSEFGPWSVIGGEAGTSYTPTQPLTQTTWFARAAQSPPCSEGLTNIVMVQVNANPTVNSASSSNICSGHQLNYTPTSATDGTTFSWTAALTSGTVTGFTASGTGPITDILSLPAGSSASGVVTYTITPVGPAPTNCIGTPFNYAVTVSPRGDVSNATLTQTICAGGTTTPVTLTSSLPGTTFTWIASVPAGISMNPWNGSGNIPGITFYSTNTGPVNVDITITPTGPNPMNCSGSAVVYTVVVNPSPTVTNSPLSQDICSGETTTPVNLTSNISGTTFTWTAVANPASLSGFTESGTSSIPAQTILNPTTANGTVTYSIIPSGNLGACPAAPRDYVITVGPRPSITSSLTAQLCSGQPFNYAITSDVINTSFLWTRSPVAGITPLSGTGVNPLINETLVNSTNASIDVVYNLTPTGPTPLSCEGTPSQLIVTVRPLPVVNAGIDQTIPCGTSTALTGTASGETLPVTPDWAPPLSIAVGVNNLNATTKNLFDNTEFTLHVVDGAGCENSDVMWVYQTGACMAANPVADPNPVCEGASTQLNAVASGGSGTYTYSWSPTETLSASDIPNPVASPTTTTTYTVDVNDGFNVFSATVTVDVTPIPEAHTVSGGGHYCQGGTGLSVNLDDSDVGVAYTLVLDGTPIPGSSLFGGGSPISWNNQTVAGNYTVTSQRNGCPAPMTGSADIFIDPLPLAYTVTGGGVYPSGGAGVSIGLSSSQLNVNYNLELIGTGIRPPSPVVGTGNPISFGLQTGVGDYRIIAEEMLLSTSCQNTMAGTVNITTNPTPSVFNVTGGGTFCFGSTGVHVGLSGSEAGLSYQLRRDGLFNTALTGTGSALDFGLFTTSGSYTVVAYNSTSGVTTEMIGIAVVTQNPRPTLFNLIPTGDQCPGTELFINGTQAGVVYELQFNGVTISSLNGTGNPGIVSLGVQTAPGTYTLIATITATGCSRAMNGTTVIVVPPQQFTVVPAGIVCQDEEIWLEESEVGISYQLIRDGIYNSGIPIDGTGGPLNFGTPNYPGVYTVRGVDPATTCAVTMLESATLYPIPTTYSIIPMGDTCAPMEIKLGGSQVDYTYWLQLNGNYPPEVILPGTGSVLSFGIHNLPGLYTVRAVSNLSQCASQMANSLTLLPRPQVHNLTMSGIICAGDPIGLDGSDLGIEYQLMFNDSVKIGVVVIGTGAPITFGGQSFAGNYTVVASNPATLCSEIMNGTATLLPNPNLYAITPQGTYCTGISIGLNGSQTGFTYRLIRDNLLSTPVAELTGNGGLLDFGPQSIPGNYNVVAVNTLTGCEASMVGNAILLPRPLVFDVLPAGQNCEPTVVSLSGSQSGVTYQLLRNDLPLTIPVIMVGTGSPLSFGPQNHGNYTVRATTASGCAILMNGTVAIAGLPVVDAGSDLTVCANIPVPVSGSATYQSSVLWTTSGNGTFDDPTQLSTNYNPAVTDITVVLELKAYGVAICLNSYASDDLTLTINRFTPGSVAAEQTICEGDVPIPFTSVPASGSGLFSYQWLQSTSGSDPWTAATGIGNGETYSAPALTSDTWYKRGISSVLNGITCTDESNAVRITVNNLSNESIGSDQTICEATVPMPLTGNVPTGDGVLAITWMQSHDCVTWTLASGTNTEITYSPPALITDTWYKRVVTSTLNGKVCTEESNMVMVTVINFTPGAIASDQTICENAQPAPFTSVAPTGDGTFTYQWMQSADGLSGWNSITIGGNNETYAAPALTADTWYKRVVTSVSPLRTCTSETNTIRVSVNNFEPGSITGTQTVCSGSVPALLTGTAPSGDGVLTYLWMQSSDGSTGWMAAAGLNTLDSYQAPVLTSDTWYKRVVTSTLNGYGCDEESNIVKISVNNFDPGSVAADQTICEGSQPAPFTSVAPLGDGSFTYQWLQSADGVAGWTAASGLNTLETYQAPVLMADMWYKRVVTSTLNAILCVSESNVVRITVNNFEPMTIGSAQTTCEGVLPDPLTGVVATGDGLFSYLWMQSPNGITDWTTATGTNNGQNYNPPALMADTWFKRVVTSTLNGVGCTEETNIVRITVNNIEPGSIATEQTVCEGDSPALFSSVAPIGDGTLTYLWMQSATGINSWADAPGPNSGLTYSAPPLVADTWYRRTAFSSLNGLMCSDHSNVVRVTVNNFEPGSISANQTICEGEEPAPFSSVAPTGDGVFTYQWQQSDDGITGWMAASGDNENETYASPALTADRWFKRVVTSTLNGTACIEETNIVRITVVNFEPGSVATDQTICEGNAPTPFTSVTPTGDGVFSYLWMTSLNGVSGWTNAPGINNLEAYSAPAPGVDTWYRRTVTATLNGTSCSKVTNIIRVTVINYDPGSIAGDQTICEGEVPAPFTSIPPSGDGQYTYLWMQSADGVTGWVSATGVNTGATYAPPALTADTWYRKVVTSTENGFTCSVSTNILRITVNNFIPGSIASDQTICEGNVPAVFSSSSPIGDGVITFRWVQSDDGVIGWTDAPGINNLEAYASPALTSDKWFKRIVTSTLNGVACVEETNVLQVAVINFNQGTIGYDQTICEGAVPNAITGTLPSGDGSFDYLWMQSPNGVNGWVAASGVNTNPSYNAPALVADTWFKRVVNATLNGVSCSKETNMIRITVNNFDPGSIFADQTICEGALPAPFTSSAATGDGVFSYLWMQSATGVSGWTAATGPNTGETYAPPILSADRWYKRTATSLLNGVSCVEESNIAQISVVNFSPGSIAADQTICEGDTPASFTSIAPSGDGGYEYLWMQSPDGSTGWADADGDNSNETYSAPALLSDTWFRRTVIATLNGVTCVKETNVVKVTVVNFNPGSVAADQTICEGEIPAALTSVAPSGDGTFSFRWQQSADGLSGWTNAVGLNSGAVYAPPALLADTWYRRMVTANVGGFTCSLPGNSVQITVNNFDAGSIAADQTICEGAVPDYFTSIAPSGDGLFTYLWQQSADGATGWTDAPGINNLEAYASPALGTDTWYRRLVTSTLNGLTCTKATNTVRVTVINFNQGSVGSDQTICEGAVPLPLTSMAPTGDGVFSYQWFQSPDGVGGWISAAGVHDLETYSPPALTSDTWYRREVTATLNGTSCMKITNMVRVSVNNFNAGSILADQTICEGDVPALFTSVTPTGDGVFTYQWLQSADGVSGWIAASGSNTDETYTAPALVADRWFKRLVTSSLNGMTCSEETNAVHVTVINFSAGSIAADQTICEGTAPNPFTSVPPAGDGAFAYLWMQSSNGVSEWTDATGDNTGETYAPPVLLADTWYRRTVMATLNGTTCQKETNIVKVTVVNFDAGSIAADQTVCEGEPPAPFTAIAPSGDGNYSYQWQQSADGVTGWSVAPGVNTGATYSAPSLAADTWYRRRVVAALNAATCTLTTNSVRVTVNNFDPGSVSADQTICEGEVPAAFISTPPSGDGEFTYLWVQSANGTSGWSDAPGINNLEAYAAPALTADSWYKRFVTSTLNGDVCVEETNVVSVTVNNFIPGSIAGDQTICEGDVPAPFSVVAPSGDGSFSYLWMQSPDGIAGWVDAAGVNTTPGYASPALVADTWYKRVVTSALNGMTCSEESNIVRVTVNNLDPGAVASDQAICEGETPAPFTSVPAIGDGVVTYLWMQSNNGSSGWIAASGIANGETYSPPALVADRWYKRVSTSSLPGKACVRESNMLAITVHELPTAILTGDAEICESESAPLTVALTGTAPWTIEYTDGTQLFTINSIMTSPFSFSVSPVVNTSYSLTAVSDAYCDGTSYIGSAFVTVNPLPFAYQLTGTGDGSFCAGEPGIELILDGSQIGIEYTLMYNSGTIGSPILGTGLPISFGLMTNPGVYYVVGTDLVTSCARQMPGIIHVTVYPLPLVNFTSDTACYGTPTAFTLTGTGVAGLVQTSWNFGDGYTATFAGGTNPTHLYPMAGVFTVTMVATDTNGCQRVVTHNVRVQDSPVSLFTWDYPNCNNIPVQFTNLSFTTQPDYIVQWVYDFGDGSVPVTINWPGNPNISHLYPASGNYTVTLTVTSNKGCSAALSRDLYITPQPSVDFSYSNGCEDGLTQFTDLSQLGVGGTVQEWTWNFGDPASGAANVSNLRNPLHNYNLAGTYQVTLIAFTSQGCADTVTKPVVIKPKPTASFTADTVCQGLHSQFTDLSVSVNNLVNTWDWDFGDGSAHSNQQNPSHLYAAAGVFPVVLTVTDTSGCIDDTTIMVRVNQLPYAAFTSSAPNCAGNEVYFTSQAASQQGYLTRWIWIYGDGETDTIDYPNSPATMHAYASAGNYTATLKVINSNGCEAQASNVVSITVNPLANFGFAAINCEESPVLFTDASQPNGGGAVTSWLWDFDDPSSGSNNLSTQQNPTHIFLNPGTFDVSLVVSSALGCVDTIVKQVVVSEKPTALFVADTACLGSPTVFTNQSVANSGVLTGYDWDFGDGSPHSNNPNPTHTYTSYGLKQVTLTVTNSNGCSASVVNPVLVARLPLAAFVPATQNCVMAEVLFDDQSTSPEGYIIQWDWDFGDGQTAVVNFPALPDVTHQYAAAGTYNVTLTVENTFGCTHSVVLPVTVQNNPAANFSTGGSTCQGMPVQFNDLTQTNGAGPVVSWNWLFGDPGSGILNVSTLQNPMHVFSSADTFDVRLIVANINGCVDTIIQQVIIGQAPLARFVADSVCFTSPTQFTDSTQSLSPVVAWLWNFGDGGTATVQNPIHTYQNWGDFSATLFVTNASGCQSDTTINVFVKPLPVAIFNYQGTCALDATQFTDVSITPAGTIDSWLWDFGDGATSTDQNPTHTFAIGGSYFVTLTVSNSFGCSQFIAQSVNISNKPTADFNHYSVFCPGGQVTFQDLTQGNGSPVTTRAWNFGNGFSSVAANPVYTYQYPDSCYTVELIVSNAAGCADTSTQQVCVKPASSFTIASEPGCAGHPTAFSPVNLAQGDTLMFVQWNFGDPASGGANTTSQYYPDHTYTTPGTYFVKLKAWNSDNCLDSTYTEITVLPAPLADFNWDAGVPHCDTTLTLYNLTVTNGAVVDSLVWSFGDGTDTVLVAPIPPAVVHHFPAYGFYNISLTAYVANGCSHSIAKRATVKCLTSEFVAPDTIACQGMTVTLNDLSAPSGAINSWLWLYGDGSYDEFFPATYNPVVTHVYDTAGVFKVKLTVTGVVNGQPVQDTISHMVVVLPAPEAAFTAANLCVGSDVVFTDQSVAANDSIVAWNWLFDDGGYSGLQNPVHRFEGDTARQVQLVVTSGSGCVDTLVQALNLGRSPVVYLSPKTGLYCNQGEDIVFSDTSGFVYQQYQWVWGDGDTTVTDTAQAGHFFEAGEYEVILTVMSAESCGLSDTARIKVKPAPLADLTLTPDSASIHDPEFYFADNSYALGSPIINWEWMVNGLTFSDDQSVLYNFANLANRVIDPDTGNFKITLWVTNLDGCRDSASKVIRIYPELLFQAPNAFTPNGDALNATFRPLVRYEIEGTYFLQIYNRWGQLLFETENREAEWDGTLDGNECPSGVYIWVVNFKKPDGRSEVHQGHVLLVR